MSRVRIVTDSTADMPEGLIEAEGLDITIVPLNVQFGAETFRDKIDITNEQFLERLVRSSALPTTSQPAVGDFEETYRRLTADGATVVSIHVSSSLSGTYGAAVLAAQNVGAGDAVRVIDSRSASLALALLPIAAGRLARAGAGAGAIVAEIESMIPRLRLIFTVDTLDFLQRGGRIGRAQALLGSLLSVKPILGLEEGVVVPVRRERTRARALDALVALAADLGPLETLGVIHIGVPQDAATLRERLAAAVTPPMDGAAILTAEIGPVVATHVGPGGLGFVACTRRA